VPLRLRHAGLAVQLTPRTLAGRRRRCRIPSVSEIDLSNVIRQSLRSNVPVGELLIAAATAAERIGDVEAAKWLDEEMHGYAFVDRLPEYRKVSLLPVDMFGGKITSLRWSEKANEVEKIAQVTHAAAELEEALCKPANGRILEYSLREDAVIIEDNARPVVLRAVVTTFYVKSLLKGVRRRINTWAEEASQRKTQADARAERAKAKPLSQDAIESPTNELARLVGRRKLFIVHGSDHAVRDRLDLYLSKELGLSTIVMAAEPMAGQTLPEKFETLAADCGFAIFILSADDHVSYVETGQRVRRPRQNVILELGYFWGRLGRHGHVAFLLDRAADIELPTDIQGIGWIPLTPDLAETKLRLHDELKRAGLIAG